MEPDFVVYMLVMSRYFVIVTLFLTLLAVGYDLKHLRKKDPNSLWIFFVCKMYALPALGLLIYHSHIAYTGRIYMLPRMLDLSLHNILVGMLFATLGYTMWYRKSLQRRLRRLMDNEPRD